MMTACGKKIEEKIEEKIGEKIIEKAIDGDVDISKDTTTIKTDQGTSQIGTDLEWPKDKMGDIPQPKGKIVGVFEDTANKSMSVTFDTMSYEDGKDYYEKLKALGYTKGMEAFSTDNLTFSGYKEDKTEILFMYSKESSAGTLVYLVDSSSAINAFAVEETIEPIVEPAEPEEIDMTDDVPWPDGFIEGLSELEGKITGISSNGNNYKNIDFEYVEKEVVIAYIEELKELGFTVDASEDMSADYISYNSYNEKDECISLNWSGDGYGYIELSKPE